MALGLVGKKIGMTREFFDSGISIPVTVVKVEKGRVIDIYTKEKNGYSAVKLGFVKIKNSKLTNQMKGFFTKMNTETKKIIKEYRVEKTEEYKTGNEIGLEAFKDVKFIDVRSQTIGKGFAGVMKKYNFAGLRASHGVSVSHRSHGSTGQRQDPGKVFKGKKMAGHMGNKIRTMQNLEIIKSDIDNDLLFVKGSIPGSKNCEVLVKKAVKNIKKGRPLFKSDYTKSIKPIKKYIFKHNKDNYDLIFNLGIAHYFIRNAGQATVSTSFDLTPFAPPQAPALQRRRLDHLLSEGACMLRHVEANQGIQRSGSYNARRAHRELSPRNRDFGNRSDKVLRPHQPSHFEHN